jgi:hypothetical protein
MGTLKFKNVQTVTSYAEALERADTLAHPGPRLVAG